MQTGEVRAGVQDGSHRGRRLCVCPQGRRHNRLPRFRSQTMTGDYGSCGDLASRQCSGARPKRVLNTCERRFCPEKPQREAISLTGRAVFSRSRLASASRLSSIARRRDVPSIPVCQKPSCGRVCQNATIPMLNSSVANVSQRVSASQAACLVGLAKRGFAITSNE